MLDRIQQAFGARLRSEQKVRQFAADASHELRTPLTTIRGYAELYRQGALGPGELPNAMRRIEQEADRMSMLVAELLELARLDRESSLDLTETDLAALAMDAVADARAVEPDRPVSADVPPSLVVTADEPRIRQVLANLLGNVRAHTPPGTPVTVRLYRPAAAPSSRSPTPAPACPSRTRRARSTASTAAPAAAAATSRRRGRDRGSTAAASACPSCRRSPPRTAGTPGCGPRPAPAPPSTCGFPSTSPDLGARPADPRGPSPSPAIPERVRAQGPSMRCGRSHQAGVR